MAPSKPSDKVIIVGGGTFGTSAAYHLSKRGYKSVVVLDRWPSPSIEAAGNDLNKVVRTEYPEPLYTKLASDAQKIWSDKNGLFQGLFHESGWIIGATERSLPFVSRSIETAEKLGVQPARPITTDEIHRRWPALAGDLPGWLSFWTERAAWVNAGEGIRRMACEAVQGGVKYISGDSGHALQFLFDEMSRCIGVKCADGTCHFGDQILLAAGAAAGGLLDLKGQIVAKGHAVGHIQLAPDEIAKYKDIPIIDHLEGGMCFPPQEDGIVKVAAVHFVTNYAPSHPHISLPRYRSDNVTDDIPKPIEAQLRKWLKEVVPELAEREFDTTRICWDGDMPDYNFLITPSPIHQNLKIAVGGSAHGFKFLPVIGHYIVQMMEETLDPEMANKWKWRPEAGTANLEDNPHPFSSEDLNDMPGWRPTTNKM